MNRVEEMEIVRMYKEAKYQRLQERILADMYLCEVEDIREILVRNGVYSASPKEKASGPGRKKGSHFKKRKVIA